MTMFTEEDFERVADMDQMYLVEEHMRMEAEWQEWEMEQEKLTRLPAIIEVVINLKPVNNEVKSNSFSL
jgi:hypothetical protein